MPEARNLEQSLHRMLSFGHLTEQKTDLNWGEADFTPWSLTDIGSLCFSVWHEAGFTTENAGVHTTFASKQKQRNSSNYIGNRNVLDTKLVSADGVVLTFFVP